MRSTNKITRGRVPYPRAGGGTGVQSYRRLTAEKTLLDISKLPAELQQHESAVPGIEEAREAAQSVHDLVAWATDASTGAAPARVRVDPAYASALIALEAPVMMLRGHLGALKRAKDPAGLQEGLPPATAAVLAAVAQVADVIVDDITDLKVAGQASALAFVQELRQRVTSVALSNELVGRDRSAAADGAVTLGKAMTKAAGTDLRSATVWRRWSVTLMLVVAALTAGILFGSPLATGDLHGDLARLSVTVPLAVLSGYMGRESSKHRDRAQRTQDLGLHLCHLRSFTSPLDEERQQTYRVDLGRRAWPSEDPPPAVDPAAGLVEELIRLTEAIRGQRTDSKG